MIVRTLLAASAALSLLASVPLARASADSEWAAIVALDKGPDRIPPPR